MDHAFPAVVTQELFEKAKAKRQSQVLTLTDSELLEMLRDIWRCEGRITTRLIDGNPRVPSTSVYLRRFGSLRGAYERIGYVQDRDLSFGDVRDRSQVWVRSVMGFLREALEEDGSSVTQEGQTQLHIDGTWSVSFHLLQSSRVGKERIQWLLPRLHSTADILVGIRMDAEGHKPLDYLILPANSAKTWPHIIQHKPKASARFYLFPSLQILRELAALSMRAPCHGRTS